MICVYPDFYRSFACKAGDCLHSCCRGWEIDVDEESSAYYRTLPGKLGRELRAALKQEDGVWHFRLKDGDRCPFLREDGLCRLILELGEQALCDICALHPRFYGELNEFEFCGLGLSCEKVCELLLSSSGPLRFVLDDEPEPIDFAALLRRMGLEPAEELLHFTPRPTQGRYRELLRRMTETEPIDAAWPEELAALREKLPEAVKKRPHTPRPVTAGATTASISTSSSAASSRRRSTSSRRWPCSPGSAPNSFSCRTRSSASIPSICAAGRSRLSTAPRTSPASCHRNDSELAYAASSSLSTAS